MEINQEEGEAFVNPAFDFYENESDSDEDIYAPEDDHRNVFDIFEDIEHQIHQKYSQYFLEVMYYTICFTSVKKIKSG